MISNNKEPKDCNPKPRKICGMADIKGFAETEALYLKENPYNIHYAKHYKHYSLHPFEMVYVYRLGNPLSIKSKITSSNIIEASKLAEVCYVLEKDLIPLKCKSLEYYCSYEDASFDKMKAYVVMFVMTLIIIAIIVLYEITKKILKIGYRKLKTKLKSSKNEQ